MGTGQDTPFYSGGRRARQGGEINNGPYPCLYTICPPRYTPSTQPGESARSHLANTPSICLVTSGAGVCAVQTHAAARLAATITTNRSNLISIASENQCVYSVSVRDLLAVIVSPAASLSWAVAGFIATKRSSELIGEMVK
jgi:hypothetical protein